VPNNIQLTGERGVIQQQLKPVPHVIHTHQPERILFEKVLQKGEMDASPISDLDTLEKSLESQLAMLDRISKYITSVTKGEIAGESTFARVIDNTLSLIPNQSTEFETIFTKGLQDLLMVAYLAELTKIHLLISENSSV